MLLLTLATAQNFTPSAEASCGSRRRRLSLSRRRPHAVPGSQHSASPSRFPPASCFLEPWSWEGQRQGTHRLKYKLHHSHPFLKNWSSAGATAVGPSAHSLPLLLPLLLHALRHSFRSCSVRWRERRLHPPPPGHLFSPRPSRHHHVGRGAARSKGRGRGREGRL